MAQRDALDDALVRILLLELAVPIEREAQRS
jgi:hypothetical protein